MYFVRNAVSKNSARPEHVVDDFEAAGINSKEDVRAVFSGNFYFGCEADDRATMWAFDPAYGRPASADLQLRLHAFRRA